MSRAGSSFPTERVEARAEPGAKSGADRESATDEQPSSARSIGARRTRNFPHGTTRSEGRRAPPPIRSARSVLEDGPTPRIPSPDSHSTALMRSATGASKGPLAVPERDPGPSSSADRATVPAAGHAPNGAGLYPTRLEPADRTARRSEPGRRRRARGWRSRSPSDRRGSAARRSSKSPRP